MNVYLLRHGRTICNEQRRYQGRLDVPLSPEGEAALRPALFSAELVYVSPLRRARQTARILFPAARQAVVPEFAEMDFGAFEARTADEMADDAAYRAWVNGGCEECCPGGEDRASFCARVCAAFETLVDGAAARGEARLVVVAHGGTLRAVMERFALPERGYFDWNAPCGGGFALAWEEPLWREGRRLRLSGELSC